MSRSTPFERGVAAKRRGKLLEHNPFARREGNSNRKRANDWALGWHSVEARAAPPSDFKWPPLVPIVVPQAGDYWVRERGLLALFRPTDALEWEVLLASMVAGVGGDAPDDMRIPYEVLRAYAESNSESIGEADDRETDAWHPLRFLWSALKIQGSGRYWPPLVVSAWQELEGMRS